MTNATRAVLLSLLVAGVFLAGSWYGQRPIGYRAVPGAGKSHHRVDPMHPAYTSDAPRVAPDFGMAPTPVHADGGIDGASGPAGHPGAVSVTADKRQLIGVRVSQVERDSAAHPLRLLGRVASDETRVYKINAGIAGYIREVSPVTTGSRIRKDQVLASFSSPDSITVIQAYLVALSAMDRLRQDGQERQAQTAAASSNFQQRLEQLQNLGMSGIQIEEITRTRQVPGQIKILSPADGLVLTRNVSAGQKFDRGAEWYQIADLGQVWILADVFPQEARHLRPGMRAAVAVPELAATLPARVAEVLPQFDEVTRTLKIRLVADNPRYVLRPGMFADVEVAVPRPPGIAVPVDAVVDSGLKKTVYVERRDGIFEPRTVEIGWRVGDRVEIVKGLIPGERIVTSGTFLVEAESRMKAGGGTGHLHDGHSHVGAATSARAAAAVARASGLATDPVCGTAVDEAQAKASGRTVAYDGQTYVFCSDECQENFTAPPTQFTRRDGGDATTPAGKRLQEAQWAGGPAASDHQGHHHH